MNPNLDEQLFDLYYNVGNSTAFGGLNKIMKAIKEKKLNISRQQAKSWLHRQRTYTLHYPIRKKFKRSRVMSYGPNWLIDGDLGFLPDLKWVTGNRPYFLLCVCTFSKFIWVIPLKTKQGKEVSEGLESVFSTCNPPAVYFRSDFGGEFFSKDSKAVFSKFGVHHYGATSFVKASFAEGAIRVVKNKLYKYFTKNPKRGSYQTALQNIVNGLNNRIHSSHGFKPSAVTIYNQDKVFKALYPEYGKKKDVALYKVGDKIRLSRLRSPFAKGFRKNYTDEIFEITSVISTRSPPMYKIKSVEDNLNVIGSFYAAEMVKVEE